MTNIFWLIIAIILWGYLHSLLASNKIKSFVKCYFGEILSSHYRIFYNIIASLSFIPVLWLINILPDTGIYIISMPWKIVAELIQLSALIFLVIAAKQTGVEEFIGIDFQPDKLNEKGQSLKTGGLYRFVRHPIYSAGLVILWCTPVMTVNYLTVAICLSIYILIGAAFEERKLIIEFKDQYLKYRKNVPMLVPRLHRNKY